MPAAAAPPRAAEIVSIDLGAFMADEGLVVGAAPTEGQLQLASAIDAACRDHGFVHVTNFGLTPDLRDAAFRAAEEIFSVSPAHKRDKYSQGTKITGYQPFQKSGSLNPRRPPDLRENFLIGCPTADPTDFSGCPAGVEETALSLWRVVVDKAAQRYAMACALALGLDADYFLRSMPRQDQCRLNMNHYPACDVEPAVTDAVGAAPPTSNIRCGEHTDYGIFTFLLQPKESVAGLQIKPVLGGTFTNSGGEGEGWLDVVSAPQPEGTVVALVNTGALMARWTNDTWRATAHRVVVPTAEVAKRARYSLACFIQPDKAAPVAVDPKFLKPGEESRYPPTTGADYLKQRYRELHRAGTGYSKL